MTYQDLKPKCPYCDAEWTEEMINLETIASTNCSSCDPDKTPEAKLEIICSSCYKLIYKK